MFHNFHILNSRLNLSFNLFEISSTSMYIDKQHNLNRDDAYIPSLKLSQLNYRTSCIHKFLHLLLLLLLLRLLHLNPLLLLRSILIHLLHLLNLLPPLPLLILVCLLHYTLFLILLLPLPTHFNATKLLSYFLCDCCSYSHHLLPLQLHELLLKFANPKDVIREVSFGATATIAIIFHCCCFEFPALIPLIIVVVVAIIIIATITIIIEIVSNWDYKWFSISSRYL